MSKEEKENIVEENEEVVKEDVLESATSPEEDGGSDNSFLEETETLRKELEETEDKYLRLQAELANIRRRHQKEREQDRLFRAQSLATDLLPVIDNLERALSIQVTEEQGTNLKKGIEMVLESFHHALKQEGIEVINPLNEPFDPQFEEAYNTIPAEEGQESGVVAQVYEKGYKLNGRILRAAKVAVTE